MKKPQIHPDIVQAPGVDENMPIGWTIKPQGIPKPGRLSPFPNYDATLPFIYSGRGELGSVFIGEVNGTTRRLVPDPSSWWGWRIEFEKWPLTALVWRHHRGPEDPTDADDFPNVIALDEPGALVNFTHAGKELQPDDFKPLEDLMPAATDFDRRITYFLSNGAVYRVKDGELSKRHLYVNIPDVEYFSPSRLMVIPGDGVMVFGNHVRLATRTIRYWDGEQYRTDFMLGTFNMAPELASMRVTGAEKVGDDDFEPVESVADEIAV